MKKKLVVLSISLCGFFGQINQTKAQSYSDLLAQNFHHKFVTNPAYAGYKEAENIWLGYRSLPANVEGRPILFNALFDMPIRNSNTGVGAGVRFQRLGAYQHLNFTGAYSYRILIDNSNSIGFGLNVGAYKQTLSISDPTSTEAQTLQAIESAGLNSSKWYVNGGFGVTYFGENIEAGIAMPQLSKESFQNRNVQTLSRAILTSNFAYRFRLDEHEIVPTLNYSYHYNYQSYFGIGAEYTYLSSFGGFAWYSLTDNNVSVGIRYDYVGICNLMLAYSTGGNFAQTTGSSIEVGVGVRFGSVR